VCGVTIQIARTQKEYHNTSRSRFLPLPLSDLFAPYRSEVTFSKDHLLKTFSRISSMHLNRTT